MSGLFLQIRAATVNDIKDDAPLVLNAKRDGHAVVFPTHVVQKRDEDALTNPIGYLSIGAVPIVMVWMDTIDAKVQDSIGCLNFTENLVRAQGHNHLIIPCMESSPYHKVMEKFGYKAIGTYTLFHKNLTQE